MSTLKFGRIADTGGHRPVQSMTGGRGIDDLLDTVARGSATALAELYDVTAPRVYGLMTRMLGDRSSADQVTLEIFVHVWQHAAQFDRARVSGPVWILTIAHQRALELIRVSAAATSDENRVATAAGNVRNSSPELIEPVD